MAEQKKPLEAPKERDLLTTRDLLNAQEKVRIQLFQNRPPQPQLPDKTVSINGYTYQIMRGKTVEVPRTVYEVLVQTGEIGPMFEEDEIYVPEISFQPIG